MCSKGWGYRCPAAKGTRCTCSCGGACHGRARGVDKGTFRQKAEDNPLWYLEEDQAAEHGHGETGQQHA